MMLFDIFLPRDPPGWRDVPPAAWTTFCAMIERRFQVETIFGRIRSSHFGNGWYFAIRETDETSLDRLRIALTVSRAVQNFLNSWVPD